MGISLFIFAGAFEVLREAWGRLRGAHPHPEVTWVSFVVMLLSLAIGVTISRYEARRGRELGSSVLLSDAAHTWSDVGGSLAVLLGLAATRFVHPVADTVVALFVALVIVRVGYTILMSSMRVVSDRAVLDPVQVERVARELQGVLGAIRIRTRGEENHTFLDMVLLVEPGLTVQAAHDLVDRVEERLQKEFPGLRDIVIHVEPGEAKPLQSQ
jgi:cation diffusion facilitator family transporter